MPITELFVSLKVPDNVAITAFHTLHRMGYHHLKNLEKQDYYKFGFSGDKKSFEKKIGKVDVLVNANKNKFSFLLENNEQGNKINILIENLEKDNELLNMLKERLNFKNIKKLEKGIIWTMYFDSEIDKEGRAINIAKDLLMNENYQRYKIL
ncbi:hypothetical protein CMO93_00590 [Candidatus Woesearchaeota archaeon]|nr:hypothetical protein [Candidatus Woesearchaeota archaeon]|tara:strand:+ start:31112 stop:31567 length:456 start_codon:yes stop_codon:yes gene_type:complete